MNQEMTAALDRIHKGHKIILREITRICRKHGIHYYLDSGTLIGAIRHKSAIPWDDDADIAMLRSDFEKFRRVAADELRFDMSSRTSWEMPCLTLFRASFCWIRPSDRTAAKSSTTGTASITI